jgi:hypothetical protein
MSSKQLPIVMLCFRFYGDSFDPEEITRQLGIEPTSQFRPGDPITKDGQGRRRHYGWRLRVGDRETLQVDDIIQEFRGRVDVPSSVVRQLCRDLNIEAAVLCGVRQGDYETTPALVFPPDFIGWVSEMGASLEVDVIL